MVEPRLVQLTKWVTHSPRNTEHLGSNSGTCRYRVSWMTTYNGGPLSLGPLPSDKRKNPRGIDKWSSLRPCLSVRGKPVTRQLGSSSWGDIAEYN